jgi:transposase
MFFVQTKLQFQAILDQVFPEYRGIFGELYSVVSLRILQEFPLSEDILKASEDLLTNNINELWKSRSLN